MTKPQYIPVSPWRLHAMAILISLLFGLLAWRILILQVFDGDWIGRSLLTEGELRFLRNETIPAWRGIITDRRGEPLAVSIPVVSLVADPGLLLDPPKRKEGEAEGPDPVEKLAGLLNNALPQAEQVTVAGLRARLEEKSDKQFMYLKRQLDPALAEKVLRGRVLGVRGEREYKRFYPAGAVTAHVVGMTNRDERGIDGVELAYERWLSGTAGSKEVIKNLHGDVVRDVGETAAAEQGQDLALSIDLRLQYLAHRELQRMVELTGAESASAVTLDAKTGEVLAMVNHPYYNPNKRADIRPGQTRNRAITDAVEPGSTVKPFTLLAALDSGLFTADSVIDTDPGYIRIGRKTIRDSARYGKLSLGGVLAKSSQVGIVKIESRLDAQAVWSMFSKLGLGRNPGTGFPGEAAGVLPYRNQWRDIERATLAYGYGLTASPLQLAQAYAVIARGGSYRPASLVLEDDLPPAEPVIEPHLAREVLDMLQGVTVDGGTGTRAQVEGYRIAGKTGTVHKLGDKGYDDHRYMGFFAGVAPADDPRLVTVVVINDPKGDRYYGGEIAAPVFSRITAGALHLMNIAPREPVAEVAAL